MTLEINGLFIFILLLIGEINIISLFHKETLWLIVNFDMFVKKLVGTKIIQCIEHLVVC